MKRQYCEDMANFFRAVAKTVAQKCLEEAVSEASALVYEPSMVAALDLVQRSMQTGESFSTALEHTDKFSSMTIQMVRVFEVTKDASVLFKLADFYEDELRMSGKSTVRDLVEASPMKWARNV